MFTNEAISGGITLQTMRYSPIMNRPLGEPILWSISACHGPFWWARRCYLGNPSYSSPWVWPSIPACFDHFGQNVLQVCRYTDLTQGCKFHRRYSSKESSACCAALWIAPWWSAPSPALIFLSAPALPAGRRPNTHVVSKSLDEGSRHKNEMRRGCTSETAGICWNLLSKKSTCDRSIGQLTEKEHLQWVSPSNVCWFTSPVK